MKEKILKEIEDLQKVKLEIENKIKEKQEELKTIKNFETIIILSEKSSLEKLTEIEETIIKIPRAGIKNIEHLGMKKLAYEIKKNKKGYYLIFDWQGTEKETIEIEKYITETKDIIKFITIRKGEED